MFQFRRFPTTCYLIHKRLMEYCSTGFPHSEIHGSRTAFVSPWLIVDRYVLHRLPMPRHSPCALISLTFFRIMCPFGFVNFTQQKNCSFLTLTIVSLEYLFSRCFHFTLPIFSCQGTVVPLNASAALLKNSSPARVSLYFSAATRSPSLYAFQGT